MKRVLPLLGSAALCALLGAGAPAHAVNLRPGQELRVQRAERVVELDPYLLGFPYLRFSASLRAQDVLFMRDAPDGRRLRVARLGDGALSLEGGEVLGGVDWSRRGLRALRWDAAHNRYLALADEANEERFNVWSLARETGALERLTDVDYVYGFGIDAAGSRLAWIPRQGRTEPYHTCLRVRDLATGTETERACDAEVLRYTWGEPSFRPSGTGLVMTALGRGDRNHQTLLYVDLADTNATPRPLLDFNARRRNVSVVREWPDETHLVYTSDEAGYTNVYSFDLASFGVRAITSFHDDVDGVVGLRVGERYLLALTVNRPAESSLYLVDPASGAVLDTVTLPMHLELLDGEGDRALLRMESRSQRLALELLTVREGPEGLRFARRELARAPASVQPDVCRVERVSVPTFDDDPHTHARRQLHAWLHIPRELPPPAERVAAVEGFYGGQNEWDLTASVLCAAGVIVLSPSVRGSAGFGAEFAALNDHDLGGNEVYDLVYSGRYLTGRREFELAENRVGVFGFSHGGYEALRAVTMPAGVNQRTEPFAWGFGVSWFGFSDIVSFYQHCNIPDWVRLEAGDPATQADFLHQRSPLLHAARATGPLLLLHGENDRRVPVDESRQMAAALRRAHRPVRYVEFAGQGHGLKGVANQRRVYHEVLSFLREASLRATAPPRRAGPSRRRRRVRAVVALALVAALALAGGLGARLRSGGTRN